MLWSKYLNDYCENINNQRSLTTGYTPNQLWSAGYYPAEHDKDASKIVIDDNSSLRDIQNSVKHKLYLNSLKQTKNITASNKTFMSGDIVRIKLPAFVEDKALSTKVKSREKDLKN